MAELTTEQHKQIWRGLMRYWSRIREPNNLDADLLTAVEATDTWIEDNQASFNNALPTVAKNNLTQAQKTLLFCAVATMRVSLEFTKKIIGGLD